MYSTEVFIVGRSDDNQTANKLSPDEFANKLAILIRAVSEKVVPAEEGVDSAASNRFALEELRINVTLTASGNLAIVSGSAEASVELHFRRASGR